MPEPSKIIMFEVESSNIKAIGYDAKAKILRISFKAGATYDYSKVPKEIFGSFMASGSIGRFFFSEIKSKYPAVKVDLPVK